HHNLTHLQSLPHPLPILLGGLLLALAPIVLLAIPWRRFAAGDPGLRRDARSAAQGQGWTLRSAMRSPLYWGLAQLFFCTSIAMLDRKSTRLHSCYVSTSY